MPKHSDHDGGLFLFIINLKELQDGGMQTTPPSQQAAPPPLAQGRLEFDFGGIAAPLYSGHLILTAVVSSCSKKGDVD